MSTLFGDPRPSVTEFDKDIQALWDAPAESGPSEHECRAIVVCDEACRPQRPRRRRGAWRDCDQYSQHVERLVTWLFGVPLLAWLFWWLVGVEVWPGLVRVWDWAVR